MIGVSNLKLSNEKSITVSFFYISE